MIRISLREEEKAVLMSFRRERKSNISERAWYVLLSDSGKTVSEIACHTGRNEHTVRLWLSRYLEKGADGLRSRKQSGRPAIKAPLIECQIKELLEGSPQEHGYREAGWQVNLLRDWFARQGLHACDNTIVKSLNRLGYVYKRFSKTLPENAPNPAQKQARIKEIIDEIGSHSGANIEIMFVDESHFSNQPYVSHGWLRTGEKKR